MVDNIDKLTDTKADLHKTIGRLALISEDLQDRTGIESTVEIVEPLSRRQHNAIRASRSKLMARLFAPEIPKNRFDLGEYSLNTPHSPNRPPDPNAVQFQTIRAGRAWVLPFTRQGDVVSRRQVITPERESRHRPNDLIIEIPERGQERIKSWMGGNEAYDGEPPAGLHNVPRIIGTGRDGEGTYFTPLGFKGLATGYHDDHALDDFIAPGDPSNLDNQAWKAERITGRILKIQENVLNRIAAENGVSPERGIPRPTHLPPPVY